MRISLIIVIIFFGLISPGFSEETGKDADEYIKRIDNSFNKNQDNLSESKELSILPEYLDVDKLDDQTKEKYFESLRESFNYRISGYQHRQKVFEWQLYSSKIIFIVVTFLVVVGIYFSGVQFHSGLKHKQQTDSSKQEDKTEIEASLKGIKVSSPILGVIILVISLLFFYLYLVYVYPITEIF